MCMPKKTQKNVQGVGVAARCQRRGANEKALQADRAELREAGLGAGGDRSPQYVTARCEPLS